MFDKIHEECGVFGIYDNDGHDVAAATYYALFALQHRGQESCGIAINDARTITVYRDGGLVNDVFDKDILASLGKGKMAVGHVRYGTSPSNKRVDAQPLVVNHVKGCMAIANNGSLTNYSQLREKLELSGSIFHTTSDSEIIAYEITRERLHTSSIEDAICNAMYHLEGSYSFVVMSPAKLIAARDPRGFRPLCIGKRNNSYMFASESCAFDNIGATFIRDVMPGEIVIIDENGIRSITTHCNTKPSSLCVFEFIYFARPDSVVDGSSVHTARIRAGRFLAQEHPVEADVVIGVPDSGIDAAIGYAQELGIDYELGFIKNKYIGRTFIQPTQADREDKVRIKLNPISSVVAGKRVVLIDDSIVRGTTSKQIVKMLRDAGAKEVHMRISCPPFMFPCFYGTDIDSQDKLIACKYSIEEIAEHIGADSLGYLSIENVVKLAAETKLNFCTSCFTGNYPTESPTSTVKSKYLCKISE
ncbi:MAG: amidophosphoribosyltransferase [Clostridia bacterium]|nr:amidophosphoribosyltransferase [Clostridia bacterium]